MTRSSKALWTLLALVCGLALAVPGLATHYEYFGAFVSGTITTTGDATIGGDLAVTGDITADEISGTTVYTSAGASIDGALTVDGTATLNGAVSVATVNGINYTPGSDTDVDVITVDVTDAPRVWWDESDTKFKVVAGAGGWHANRLYAQVAAYLDTVFPFNTDADLEIRLLNDAYDISFLNASNGEFMAFNPTNGADFQGGITHNRTATIDGGTCTTGYSTVVSDYFVGVLCANTAATITLPTAQTIEGRVIHIKDEAGGASGNNITIDPQAADVIDGASTAVITTDYGSVSVYSDGTNWFIY